MAPPRGTRVIRVAASWNVRVRYALYLCLMVVLRAAAGIGLGKFTDRLRTPIYRRMFFPHISWDWGKRAVKEATEELDAFRPDVIIGTHPGLGNLRAADLLSSRSGIPWFADIRDPIHNDHQLGSQWASRHLEPIEKSLLDSAARVFTINEYLASMLRTTSPISIITQSVPHSPEQPADTDTSNQNSVLKIVYTGTIHEKSCYRTFFCGLLALPKTADQNVEIHYYGGQFHLIADYTSELQERGFLLIDHGFVSSEECGEALLLADLLLVFGWAEEGYQCVLTGKVFDYLAVGIPIVAITRQGCALEDLIRQTGTGEVLFSPQRVTEFLKALVMSPGENLLKLTQQRQPQEISRYQQNAVAASLEQILLSDLNIGEVDDRSRLRL